MAPFALYGLFIGGACSANALHFGDFGHRNIPPGLVAGNAHFLIDLNNHYGCGLMVAHLGNRPLDFMESSGPNRSSAVSLREFDKVDRNIIAVELPRLGAVAVIRAESLRPNGVREAADAAESMIIEQNDVQLVAFLDGGHNL